MKTLFITMVCCAVIGLMHAQPYGQINYPNGSALTSGSKTQINSNGFIMAGVINVAGVQRIRLEKSGVGGVLPGGINEFQKAYNIAIPSVAGSCNNTMSWLSSGLDGVSVIETNNSSGAGWYALAGAYPAGCFFATLSSTGGVSNLMLYNFSNSNASVLKPVIAQSQANPANFFIAGKMDTCMYVIKINQTGNVLWSHYYTAGGGLMEPGAIIESPYNNNEVVVVGRGQGTPFVNRANDGFFMVLSSSNGGVTNFKLIGDAIGTSASCNWFSSIAPAACPNGGVGYIIGGYSDWYGTTPSNYGFNWMLKVGNAGNLIWSRILTSSFDPSGGHHIVSVAERFNTTTNAYEYYGLGKTDFGGYTYGLGVITYKLDANGLPYHMTHPGIKDEFYYPASSTSPNMPISLSFKDVGAPSDRGLHLFGNKNGNHYLIESYFNGVTGCNEQLGLILASETGHNAITVPVTVYGGLIACNWISFDLASAQNTTPGIICSASGVVGGSNSRMIATGIGDVAVEHESLLAFPNPSNGLFHVVSKTNKQAALFNVLGQQVMVLELTAGNTAIDLSSQADGVYVLKILGEEGKQLKLIKQQ